MKLQNLILKNYRNYPNLNIDFSDTLNIIYGNNGSGKSNLIEAIYLLALTKSFRTNNDLNLIKNNEQSMSVNGKILSNDELTSYQIDLSNEGKKVYIDSDKIAKISDYVTKINIVLFNPLDTRIISDSPAFRRRMLNIEISQINKDYLELLSNYNKILKNRNAYLKQLLVNANSSTEYLDILTKKLVEYGIKISEIRKEFIDLINEQITNIYQNIFNKGKLIIKYKCSYLNKDFDKILEMYQKNYRKEINYSKTLFGIHHDDIDILLDDHSIKEFGSVGQQKNAIISLKLSEILIIKKIKNDFPLLILDDLFSELDNEKINNIIKMLNKEVQTFITTTNIDNVNKNLLKDAALYEIIEGKVERKDK